MNENVALNKIFSVNKFNKHYGISWKFYLHLRQQSVGISTGTLKCNENDIMNVIYNSTYFIIIIIAIKMAVIIIAIKTIHKKDERNLHPYWILRLGT